MSAKAALCGLGFQARFPQSIGSSFNPAVAPDMPASPKTSVKVANDEQQPRAFLPVTGASGGPAPDGLTVIAHLYTEFTTIPATQDYPILEDGRVNLSAPQAENSRSDVIRQLLATIVMAPEAAVNIGKWLAQRGEQAIKLRKENEKA